MMKVLREIKRVLKPGGRFYFLDHVLGPEGSFAQKVHNCLTNSGIWPFLMDGCQLNRDIGACVKEAGFEEADITEFKAPLPILGPHVFGIAKK